MVWWQRAKSPQIAEQIDKVPTTAHAKGQQAEAQALAYLQSQGLALVARNYKTPGRGGGEIDLILRTLDGTVVFVEVRSRSHCGFGGAAQSIGVTKRQRIVLAARHWLLHTGVQSACRFDVVLIDGPQLQWLRGAFDAS